ncbi:MAG: T9SS type A sorting domain-containing protein [Bacteroidetes bacterium]|nr:T9SS type A sorting domain-containing protein [Bacteroidota bacterium]
MYASNIVIAGSGFRCDHTETAIINYFTCFPTGDPRLWIESYETGLNGRILGYNDDYAGSGDFIWQQNARVKKSYSQRMWNCFVTSASTYYPTGTCDLYMRCKNYTGRLLSPYFKADDAILSARKTDQTPGSDPGWPYTCYGWAGGVTSYVIDPAQPGQIFHWDTGRDEPNYWYDPTSDTHSFDNFYGNNPVPRYAGAWSYTNAGATAANSLIDLYWKIDHYSHAAVNSRWQSNPNLEPANGYPHGYDWESKDGDYERFFHPRYALQSHFGYITRYYKFGGLSKNSLSKSTSEYITDEESIKRGLSKVDKTTLTDDELFIIMDLKEKFLKDSEINEFNSKYNAWRATWSSPEISTQSSLISHAESEEYFDFIYYCLSAGKKVLPLLIEKLNFEKQFYVIMPMIDLTYKGNKKVMDDILNENSNNLYTEEGVFVIYTQQGNWLKYGKKLLEDFDKYKDFTPSPRLGDSKPKRIAVDSENEFMIKNYPNPFNPSTQISYYIASESKISIKIFDILGKEVIALIDNEFQTAGWHNTQWNGRDISGSSVSSGIYFCRIICNSQVQTVKMMLMK